MYASVAKCILNAFFAWGDEHNYLTHKEWASDFRDVIKAALNDCGQDVNEMPWTTELRHRLGMHDPETETDPVASIPRRATVKQLRDLLEDYPDDAYVEVALHGSGSSTSVEDTMKGIDSLLSQTRDSIRYSLEALDNNFRDGDHLVLDGDARLISLADDSIVVLR